MLTSNVVLRDLLLGQPLGQHVVHGLGRVQDGEREIRLVLREGVNALISCRVLSFALQSPKKNSVQPLSRKKEEDQDEEDEDGKVIKPGFSGHALG